MEADEVLQREGLILPRFRPPSDPPWTWTGALGYEAPLWIPKIQGARWVGAMDTLAAPPLEADMCRDVLLSQAEALDRAHGPPSNASPKHSLISAPWMRERLAPTLPVTRLLEQSYGPMWMPQLPVRLLRTGYGRPRLEDECPDYVQRIAWLNALCVHDAVRRRGSKLVHETRTWSTRGLAQALYGDDDEHRKKTQREIRAGQGLLQEHGVIPWVAWRDGRLPTKWWQEPSFRQVISMWAIEAVVTTQLGRDALHDRELCSAIAQTIVRAD
jgi:hypothetical protein